MDEPPLARPRYLDVAPNSCLRVVDGDRWVSSVTVRVGDHHVAIRAGSFDVEEVLRQMLAPHLVDDEDAPASFGVQVTRAGLPTARPHFHVYEGCSPILASRSCERAVAMIAGHLDRLMPGADRGDRTLRLAVHTIVGRDGAMLVPWRLPYRLPTAELRLARFGLRQLERTTVDVDPRRATVLVGPNRLLSHWRAGVGAGPEGVAPLTVAGDRALVGWIFPGSDGRLSRAQAVARGMETVLDRQRGREAFRDLANLVERVDLFLSCGPEQAVTAAVERLSNAGSGV